MRPTVRRIIRDNSPLIRIYPELAFFRDPEHRYAAHRAAFKTVRGWHILFGLFCGGVAQAIAGVFRRIVAQLSLPLVIPDLVFSLAGGAFSGLVLVFILRSLYYKRVQRSLREQLVAQGTPICLECGYDLRGQIEARCPECGTPFDEMLLRPKPDANASLDNAGSDLPRDSNPRAHGYATSSEPTAPAEDDQ